MLKRTIIPALGMAAALFGGSAEADTITYAGSDSTLGLSAAATFIVAGNQLVVTLSNTSGNDVTNASQLLTAVFFNFASNPTLTGISAAIAGNSAAYQGTALVNSPATNIGGEWAYRGNLSQYGDNYGISSSGLGLFGPDDRFNSIDLSPPASPDGPNYGITSAGDNLATANGSLTDPIIKNTAFFVFLLPGFGFSASDIDNVVFQYGTSLNEPIVRGDPGGPANNVPEPGIVALLGVGLAALSMRKRTRT